ncbi:MAG: septal ring lytic transglycosylase RlpA family protein [Alphaproteobacteria bacterium]|nr:septal ring lytic transglycosylase RlpA family protein [Alphaproteobacteria bacterium]
MPFQWSFKTIASLALAAALCACSSQSTGSRAPAAAHYKIGQPYQIKDQWYYPREDYNYDETGIASWYGADFHNHPTANGEIYNKDELTAAHKTLPLPSLARVTNLDNGRSIVVRVNDRGPFASGRIIDMSQRSAQLLGFERQGTAKVRVQVLADESKAIADAMRRYGSPAETARPVQLASASDETKTLRPIRTTEETHRELLATKPVPYAIQLPVTGQNRIYVQAGAFAVPQNAQRLRDRLSSLGPTSVTTAVVNGTKFYRVRVGPVADVPGADALLEKLKLAGVAGARTAVD